MEDKKLLGRYLAGKLSPEEKKKLEEELEKLDSPKPKKERKKFWHLKKEQSKEKREIDFFEGVIGFYEIIKEEQDIRNKLEYYREKKAYLENYPLLPYEKKEPLQGTINRVSSEIKRDIVSLRQMLEETKYTIEHLEKAENELIKSLDSRSTMELSCNDYRTLVSFIREIFSKNLVPIKKHLNSRLDEIKRRIESAIEETLSL